jgi:hypothetical protein
MATIEVKGLGTISNNGTQLTTEKIFESAFVYSSQLYGIYIFSNLKFWYWCLCSNAVTCLTCDYNHPLWRNKTCLKIIPVPSKDYIHYFFAIFTYNSNIYIYRYQGEKIRMIPNLVDISFKTIMGDTFNNAFMSDDNKLVILMNHFDTKSGESVFVNVCDIVTLDVKSFNIPNICSSIITTLNDERVIVAEDHARRNIFYVYSIGLQTLIGTFQVAADIVYITDTSCSNERFNIVVVEADTYLWTCHLYLSHQGDVVLVKEDVVPWKSVNIPLYKVYNDDTKITTGFLLIDVIQKYVPDTKPARPIPCVSKSIN